MKQTKQKKGIIVLMREAEELSKVREVIKGKTSSEIFEFDEDDHNEITSEIQELNSKMNQEKLEAFEKIESKYKERIQELQRSYAISLRLFV